mgnify:CR=1 FL=1
MNIILVDVFSWCDKKTAYRQIEDILKLHYLEKCIPTVVLDVHNLSMALKEIG